MSTALYRKYRSKKLSEIVGQDHITTALSNAIKNDRISHAYLFTGPRGVGKTSIARILAHEINQLPYTDESTHLDIIEIDAASNRRIDEIRDLRDKVHITPTSSKYKVYIIDEVHMLTREAFNALLKTLEEPPKHVVFILATTEIHKLPETIISRTQRYTFKSIDQKQAAQHLATIAKSEGIKIDKDALEILAIHGNGSFRDSISMLDQVGSGNKTIKKTDIEKLVGVASTEHIDGLLNSVISGKLSDIADRLEAGVEDGISPVKIAKQLSTKLRSKILQEGADNKIIELLNSLIDVGASHEPFASLEVVLFKANLELSPNNTKTATSKAKPMQETAQAPKLAQAKVESVNAEVVTKPEAGNQNVAKDRLKKSEDIATSKQEQSQSEIEANSDSAPATASRSVSDLSEWWDDFLLQIKANNNTLHSILKMADANINGDKLDLVFKFMLHKKKIADPATKSKIQSLIKDITGSSLALNPILKKDLLEMSKLEDVAKNSTNDTDTESLNSDTSGSTGEEGSDLSNIAKVFDGAEVV